MVYGPLEFCNSIFRSPKFLSRADLTVGGDNSRATRRNCYESRLTHRVVNVVGRKDSRVVLGVLRAQRGSKQFSSRGQTATLWTKLRGLAGEPLADAGVYGGSMYRRPLFPSDCAGATTGPVIGKTGHNVAKFPIDHGARAQGEKSSDLLAPTSTSTDAYHGVTRRPASPPGRAKRGEERTMTAKRTR